MSRESHRQFCPVALAADILARRWTLLVVRELLCGSVRFNDIHRGVPRMSRSLLSRRLGELEEAGVLQRRLVGDDDRPEYHLTPAGQELEPLVVQLGTWGRRWLRSRLSRDHLDAGLLMWDVRRRIVRDVLPRQRVVVRFRFPDCDEPPSDFWLVLDDPIVDLCIDDPGHGVDLDVVAELAALTDVWLGDTRIARALREERIRLRGPSHLRRAFSGWLGLSLFADVDAPARA